MSREMRREAHRAGDDLGRLGWTCLILEDPDEGPGPGGRTLYVHMRAGEPDVMNP